MKVKSKSGLEIDFKEIVTIAIREKGNGYEVEVGTKKFGFSTIARFETKDRARTYVRKIKEGLPI